MDPADIVVSVAYSPLAGQLDVLELRLPAGATVAMALHRSGLLDLHPGIDLTQHAVGVWGKLRSLDDTLRDADRVELYRPLQVDPKEARRLRYKKHRETLARSKP